ncbi:unnamed protein product [Peniophora sp. CBMAI 1063]|nr:unnamed protein product [Peniophora sp. CBMAI 1063]
MFTRAALLAALVPAVLGLNILFPAYFCGDGDDCDTKSCAQYTAIVNPLAGHSNVHLYTIINPDNGPMSTSDLYPNYVTCIPTLKNAASSTVLGYVSTGYGDRSTSDVEADLDTYATWPTSYRPSGIFFDEVPDGSGQVSQYASYATYARNKGFSYIVFNPGTTANLGYFSAADLLVTYEDAYSGFSTSDLTISSSAPAAKQAIILYGGPSSAPASLISQIGALGAGAVFITDDTLDNPYDTVPTIWTDEVADVAAA